MQQKICNFWDPSKLKHTVQHQISQNSRPFEAKEHSKTLQKDKYNGVMHSFNRVLLQCRLSLKFCCLLQPSSPSTRNLHHHFQDLQEKKEKGFTMSSSSREKSFTTFDSRETQKPKNPSILKTLMAKSLKSFERGQRVSESLLCKREKVSDGL